jgi:hypothetical protein
MATQKDWHGAADYKIKVKGKLGRQWSDWFESMTITSEGSITTLTGKIPDQPALHGLLIRIRDLGVPLISVERFESEQNNRK